MANIQEEILSKQALDLIKLGFSTIEDILALCQEKADDKRYYQLRSDVTGKYTTILQDDVNINDIKDYCQSHHINLMSANYKDTDKNVLGGYEINNTKVREVYQAVYERSIDRNELIVDVLKRNNIPYKTVEYRCDYRENGSGNAEHEKLSYKEQLFVRTEDIDTVLNLPELMHLKEYIQDADISVLKDVVEPTEQSNIDIEQQLINIVLSNDAHRTPDADAILHHKTYESVYDKDTNRIIINADKNEVYPFIKEYFPDAVNQIIYVNDRAIFQIYVDRNSDIEPIKEEELEQEQETEEEQEFEESLESEQEIEREKEYSENEKEEQPFDSDELANEEELERELEQDEYTSEDKNDESYNYEETATIPIDEYEEDQTYQDAEKAENSPVDDNEYSYDEDDEPEQEYERERDYETSYDDEQASEYNAEDEQDYDEQNYDEYNPEDAEYELEREKEQTPDNNEYDTYEDGYDSADNDMPSDVSSYEETEYDSSAAISDTSDDITESNNTAEEIDKSIASTESVGHEEQSITDSDDLRYETSTAYEQSTDDNSTSKSAYEDINVNAASAPSEPINTGYSETATSREDNDIQSATSTADIPTENLVFTNSATSNNNDNYTTSMPASKPASLNQSEKDYVDSILFGDDTKSGYDNVSNPALASAKNNTCSIGTDNSQSMKATSGGGFTADEISQEVKDSVSNRNYYDVKNRSTNIAERTLNSAKSHQKNTGSGDETVEGADKLSKPSQRMTAIFGAQGLAEENAKKVSAMIATMDDGKMPMIASYMGTNKLSIKDAASLQSTAAHMKRQMAASGLDVNQFLLHGDKYIIKNKAKMESAFGRMSHNDMLTFSAEMKQVFKIDDTLVLQKRLKRQSGKLSQDAIKAMGSENMEGLMKINSYVHTTDATLRSFQTLRDLQITYKSKKLNLKVRRYEESMVKTNHKINNAVSKASNPSVPLDPMKSSQQQVKADKYREHLKKLEEKKAKRLEKQQKLTNVKAKRDEKRIAKSNGVASKLEYKLSQQKAKLAKMEATGVKQAKIDSLKKAIDKNEKKLAKKVARKTKLSNIKTTLGDTFAGRAVGTIFKPLNTLFKWKAKLNQFFTKLLLSIGKGLLYFLGVILACYVIALISATCYGIFSSVMASFLSTEKTPLDTPMGKTYLKLKEIEYTWVQEVKNTGAGYYTLDEIDTMIDWNAEINNSVDEAGTNEGYSYSDNQIIADPHGLGENYAGVITMVDGGTESTFANVNNNTSLSNIKDIMVLCSAFYDDSFSEYRMDVKGFLPNIQNALANIQTVFSGAVSGVKNGITAVINGLFGTTIDTSTGYDYVELLAYESYSSALFTASHDTSTTLGKIAILPTADKADEVTLEEAENGFGKVSGARILCTHEHGCATPDGLFYWDADGNLKTEDGISATTAGTGLNTLIYVEKANEDDPYCYELTSDEDREHSNCWEGEVKTKEVPVTDNNGNPVYNEDGSQETTTEEYIEWTLKCQGHHGSYCAGHVVIRTTGIIHGIPTDLATGRETAHKDYEEMRTVEETENPVISPTTVIGTDINITDDIFAIDTKIEHNFIPTTWQGWTADKVDYAALRYTSDWEMIYGFDVETSISNAVVGSGGVVGGLGGGTGYFGSNTYSNDDIDDIIEKIKGQYTITEDVENRLRIGLGYVGKVGYSQGKHSSKFVENGGSSYTYSDCSGFASNVWLDKVGSIMSCYYLDEYGKQQGNRHEMNNGAINSMEPGDIILAMDGKYNGGTSNHAMIYLGTFDGEIWCVECTSANGGGIFYMSRGYDWYMRPGSFYLDMT